MKKVILLDGAAIQAIPVARSLRNLGYHVVSLCHSKNSYGYRTRYVDRKIISPSTRTELEAFHHLFYKLVKNEKFDFCIPMGDYSAQYLSRHKNELEQFTSFVIPSYDVFMNGYDKNELMRTCLEYGFPHPRSFDLALDNTAKAGEYTGFPALIKPNHTTGARGFSIVTSRDDLAEKLPGIVSGYGACHLQELIPPGGRQFKVELFVHEGGVVNSTVIHKMRFYPEKGGSSCFNQSIQRDDLVKLCADVLDVIKWNGFADFDLIEDPRDQIIKIMEINPRIPACIKASFNAGVDFAENIARASMGEKPTVYKYKPGGYLRYFGMDLLWFLKSRNRFKTTPSWFKGFLSSKHHFQDGSLSDPMPFICGTVGGILKQLNPTFRAAKQGMNE